MGASETLSRKLLHACEVHTLLRLSTGLLYAQEIVDDLEAALEQFRLIAGDLGADVAQPA